MFIMVRGEGAESVTFTKDAYGKRLLFKVRQRKRYRVGELDERLRRSRTRSEARILSRLSESGLPVPTPVAVGTYTIVMTLLEGRLMRDVRIGPELLRGLGGVVRGMHGVGVVHGDLTPANILVSKGRPYIIDFGLGLMTRSNEERALDLLLMKRSLGGREFRIFVGAYSKGNKEAEAVMEKLAEIERRGRYSIRTLT